VSAEPERLLTARQLAGLLGLSPATVLDRFERGDLPGFRLYGGRKGSPVRFRWSEVEAWLECGRCGPPAGGGPGGGGEAPATPSNRPATALVSPMPATSAQGGEDDA
jgi:excisionase family DNA binding protein